MSTSLHYVLSIAADEDLSEIYDFTVKAFGEPQAIKYLTALEDLFEILCSEPELGRERPEIMVGLRSMS